jgi:hypothetical protein
MYFIRFGGKAAKTNEKEGTFRMRMGTAPGQSMPHICRDMA